MKKLILLITMVALGQLTFAQNWHTSFTSSATGNSPVMAEGPNGEAYLCYINQQNGYPIVKKFNGSSWSDVGSTGIEIWASNPKIAVDANGRPYVAFADVNRNFQLTVMYLNGNQWDTLGPRGFSAFTSVGELDLETNGTTVYAAYQQYNQIKLWSHTGNPADSWTIRKDGTSESAATGFPGSCNLYKTYYDYVFLSYLETTSKKNAVRVLNPTTPGYTTISNNYFSSAVQGNVEVIAIPTKSYGNVLISLSKSGSTYLKPYFFLSGTWSPSPQVPIAAQTFSFGLYDSLPVMVIKDNQNYCRFLIADIINNKYDSLGSSFVTTGTIQGTPNLLVVGRQKNIVAYQGSDGMIYVKLLCLPISNAVINTSLSGLTTKVCKGGAIGLTANKLASNYKWFRNGVEQANSNSKTYAALVGGTYTVRLFNECGDSTLSAPTELIQGDTTKPTITNTNGALTSSSALLYNWYKNGQDLEINTQSYTPTSAGNYSVKIMNADSCIISSDEFVFNTAAIALLNQSTSKIYPNPFSTNLNIENKTNEAITYTVYDVVGQVKATYIVMPITTQQLEVANWAAGLYIIKTNISGSMRLIKN